MVFIEITNTLFNNKSKYKNISDKDKEDAFYIINKKMYLGKKNNRTLSTISNFFNKKNMDKASCLDLWFLYLQDIKNTPHWWFTKNPFTKTKVKKVPKADKEMLMEYENITEKEYDFLYEHYKDDVEYKIKLLKRLD